MKKLILGLILILSLSSCGVMYELANYDYHYYTPYRYYYQPRVIHPYYRTYPQFRNTHPHFKH